MISELISRLSARPLLLLLALSFITHFIFLTTPREVVFDEVHFGKFITAYCCTGENFFDIHPPHAKLLITAVAKVSSYRGDFSFEHIGQPYQGVPIGPLRAIPALIGTFFPLVIYALMRQLGAGKTLSFLAGWLIIFDNALTVQTRFILLDGLLLISTFGALSLALAAINKAGWPRLVLFAAAGLAAGLAAGAKLTGLLALALILLVIFREAIRELPIAKLYRKLLASRGNIISLGRIPPWRSLFSWLSITALVILGGLIIYLAGWAVHFALLPNAGPGDAFYIPDFSEAPLLSGFITNTIEFHRVMFSANYNLEATHPDASQWWSWPFLQTAVYYWQGEDAAIYFLGNPVVWWGSGLLFTIALALSLMDFARRPAKTKNKKPINLWLPFWGFIIAYLPLTRVPRALFLYHYLTPLIFSLIFGLLWLEKTGAINSRNHRQRYFLATALIASVASFIFFSPITYGYSVPPDISKFLFWFPGWR